jgi:isopropylmalate/homocitrate/citramalate synthase
MTSEPQAATPWHTQSWFTSPWNHGADVAGQVAFPESVQIHDVTLRDGEQQAGVCFTTDDKVRIAEALAGAGVHRIEAGLPAVSPADFDAVKRIASMGLPSQVYAFSRCTLDDVQRAIDCGVHGVVMEIPSSRHLIELGYRWSVERAVDLSVAATKRAHEAGLKVSFFPIDATRASVEDYLNLVEKVATDGHVDGLGLVDTFGVLTPHAVEGFVRASRDRLKVPLEAHFHMDYGLGVANSLIAAASGAAVIQTTVSGLGERAGNTPMEEVVLALLTLYGVNPGIVTEKLTPLARLVAELSGVQQPSNRAVTGTRLFDVESGIIANWVRNVRDVDRTEALPYLPELVGQTGPDIVVGKGSGMDNVVEYLGRAGLEATEAQRLDILAQVKEFGLAHKRLLTLDEFTQTARSVLGAQG